MKATDIYEANYESQYIYFLNQPMVDSHSYPAK